MPIYKKGGGTIGTNVTCWHECDVVGTNAFTLNDATYSCHLWHEC